MEESPPLGAGFFNFSRELSAKSAKKINGKTGLSTLFTK
jgi:hypothetical protein